MKRRGIVNIPDSSSDLRKEVIKYAKENEHSYKDYYNVSYSSDTHSACNFTEFLKVSLLTETYADELFVKVCADFLKLRIEIYNTSNLKGVPLIFNDSESNLTLQIIYDPFCQHYASLKKINMNQQYKLEQSRQISSKMTVSLNLMPNFNNGQKLVVRETLPEECQETLQERQKTLNQEAVSKCR